MHNSVKIKARKLSGLFEKSIGLVGRKPEAVFFKTRFGIHTFGMKYPIDVLILDKNFQVVKIKEDLKPSNLFFWNIIHFNVLELPAGAVREQKISKGTSIIIS